MSAPIQPSVWPPLDFKEVSRQLESFQHVDSTRQQLLERLLQRLSELDTALQAANSDLEDQTSIRRQWKKRAEVAEASLAQNQFVLALIDGNRYTFADSYLKNTETGGADAARDLAAQIRNYIQENGLANDPSKVTLMVHIFANKTAMSQALVDSGTISGPGEFDEFIAQFMCGRPFLYFMDCGSSEGAVDSKIQGQLSNFCSEFDLLTFSKNPTSFTLKMLIASIFYWRYVTNQGTLLSLIHIERM
jgi:hypothetical protein